MWQTGKRLENVWKMPIAALMPLQLLRAMKWASSASEQFVGHVTALTSYKLHWSRDF